MVNKLNWDYRLIILFVLAGIITMIYGVWSYLNQLLRMYGDSKKSSSAKLDKRDYDYNDDNYRIKKKKHDE